MHHEIWCVIARSFFTSPVTLGEKRPAATRPLGEGSATHQQCPPSSHSLLAFRAIKTRTLSHHHVFDRRRACVARFSLATVHAQARGESSRLSARIAVAAESGAVVANRGAQDDRRGRCDFFDLATRHPAGTPRRTHARLK